MAFILSSDQFIEEWKLGTGYSIQVKQKVKEIEKATKDWFQMYHLEILGTS